MGFAAGTLKYAFDSVLNPNQWTTREHSYTPICV